MQPPSRWFSRSLTSFGTEWRVFFFYSERVRATARARILGGDVLFDLETSRHLKEVAPKYKNPQPHGNKWRAVACPSTDASTSYKCSRPIGHKGVHVAHFLDGTPGAYWPRDARGEKP